MDLATMEIWSTRVKVTQGFLSIVLLFYSSPYPNLQITHLQNKKEEATRLPLGTISLGADMTRWQYIYCLLLETYQHEAWCQRWHNLPTGHNSKILSNSMTPSFVRTRFTVTDASNVSPTLSSPLSDAFSRRMHNTSVGFTDASNITFFNYMFHRDGN